MQNGEPAWPRRRRLIRILAALGAVDFSIISLYQLEWIRHLPDPSGKLFDSDGVNASPTAYALGVPDGLLGLGLFAAVLVLVSQRAEASTLQALRARALTGRRALAGAGELALPAPGERPPALDLALGGAAAAGALGAAYYLYDMAFHQKKACAYCLVGAAINFGLLALAWPRASSAARHAVSSGLRQSAC